MGVYLHDILCETAEAGISIQQEDGSMPQGHNGPWKDNDTPVRNTSHWLILFLKAYDITDGVHFRKAAENAVSYLMSDIARPGGYTFYHRDTGRDFCNGLIGQAWTIESLAIASKVLNRSDIHELATTVFSLHPFDSNWGIWKRIDIHGEPSGYCFTFNQQLWFALAGSLLDNSEIQKQIRIFLKNLIKNIKILSDGIIHHKLRRDLSVSGLIKSINEPSSLKNTARLLKSEYINKRDDVSEQISRSIGYHSFNIYAIAFLKDRYPSLDIWDSSRILKTYQVINSQEYCDRLVNNKYAYQYNPTGIENAYVTSIFNTDEEKSQWWLQQQLRQHYDSNRNLMSANTGDENTLSSRLYQAVRLPNYKLRI